FRASKVMRSDGLGWTYHHHVDMACWRGRLYVGWNSCERDEDVWPSRELYSTSIDGRTWTDPVELFPQGVSTPLRMYYFHAAAPHHRMLAIAGLRIDQADTDEDTKGGLVVREIRTDHTLGDVFTLQPPPRVAVGPKAHAFPSNFDTSPDTGFVAACRELLADRIFLEQQDRGRLLGARRMKWHDASAWPAGSVPGDNEKWVAGKAYSFFRRPDGLLVGVSKMGWTTTSRDDGQTWSQPLVPPTLVTGKAKVWSQQTSDGRFALVYNPSARNRFPLAVVTSDDGVTFRDMRIVQGELPVQRYAGLHRSIGPQYVRGISRWSNDGSRAGEGAMWLVYSMSKEDIWVTRVSVPILSDAINADAIGWNLYSPTWAPATIEGDEIRLEDREPYDYASATRVFPETRGATITFEALAEQTGATLHVDAYPHIGGEPTATLAVTASAAGAWKSYELRVSTLHRVTFRTAEARGIGGSQPVDPETDRPTPPVAFRMRGVRLRQ
ncbi:MAG: exo-alpha-sialidase, partial [Tepidisphaeraceae bacterium]